MMQFATQFQFFDSGEVDVMKISRSLSTIEKPRTLYCYLFAEKRILNAVLSDEVVAQKLESRERQADRCATTRLDRSSTLAVVASVVSSVNNERYNKPYYQFFVFLPEECDRMLDDLVRGLLENQSNLFENSSVGSTGLLAFLEQLQVWSLGSEYENQLLEETLLHHFLVKRNSEMTTVLVQFGCKPDLRRLIMRIDNQTIKYASSVGLITQEMLETQFPFHCISYTYASNFRNYHKLEDIFQSIASCARPGELLRLFRLKSAENKNLNAVEYACRVQADKIFDLLLNFERGLKTTDSALNYDVSSLIPDTLVAWNEDFSEGPTVLTIEPVKTVLNTFQTSCLERIIASSELNEGRASKLLLVKPISYLIESYILTSKFIGMVMFLIQTIFMIVFTWFNMNKVSDNIAVLLNHTCNPLGDDFETKVTNCTTVNLDFPRVTAFLWLIWPLVVLVYSTYQFVAISKMLTHCQVKASFGKSLGRFPWLDLMIFISMLLWWQIVVFQSLPGSYFQLTAVIFIVGWLRTALFISFCSHWHGFVVALQSSLSKYFVSFIFVFFFIYVGFSFALRILLTEYASVEKPLYIVAFTTLVAVFGMGNLDEIPEEVEQTVGKALFLKMVIISYCSLVAILVLAIIRQPDTELVVRVGSELFPRLKLQLLKDVVWLMRWRRSRAIARIGEPEFGSCMHSFYELFGIRVGVLKKSQDKYVLRVLKEEDEGTDEVESDARSEMLLKEIINVQHRLEELAMKVESAATTATKQ